MQTNYNPGDLVQILPEWQDQGDADLTFRVHEWNGDRGVLTVDEQSGMPIQPTYRVSEYMIAPLF